MGKIWKTIGSIGKLWKDWWITVGWSGISMNFIEIPTWEATICGVRKVAAWDVWLVSPILNPEMGSFANKCGDSPMTERGSARKMSGFKTQIEAIKNIGVTLQVPHGPHILLVYRIPHHIIFLGVQIPIGLQDDQLTIKGAMKLVKHTWNQYLSKPPGPVLWKPWGPLLGRGDAPGALQQAGRNYLS